MLPPPRRSISGTTAARQRDQRIGADVERDPETLARGLDERVRQLGLRRERRAVHEEIEPAELAVERGGEVRDLLVARHVARQDQRVVELRGELADVFLEPLARIGQREARARPRRRLRDRPRDRPLVGDTNDEAVFAGEVGQGLFLTACGRRTVTARQTARGHGPGRGAAAMARPRVTGPPRHAGRCRRPLPFERSPRNGWPPPR